MKALAFALAILVLGAVPHRVAKSGASAWYDGEAASQIALARGVEHWLDADLSRDSFTTHHPRFDAEWLFGTHFMAAMGFGQVALSHPEARAEMVAAMDRALDRLVEPDLAAFDREGWGEAALESDRGHVAYLGYLGLALALRKRLGPSRHDALGERIRQALLARFEAEPLVETYPGERYPVDNAAAIAALAEWARDETPPPAVTRFVAYLQEHLLDRQSGMLIQSVGPRGEPSDAPRASGTALASYFLAFVDPSLAERLHASLERSAGDAVLGFGAVDEYPPGHDGHGDVDSGPLIAGFSISGTGFSLAGARRFGTRARFAELWASTQLFGLPRQRGERLHFVLGGPLGDAILFAMLTARSEP